jgi:hypothetical protein
MNIHDHTFSSIQTKGLEIACPRILSCDYLLEDNHAIAPSMSALEITLAYLRA